MAAEWILSPCLSYGFLAGGLGFSLYLFYTVKIEVQALRKRTAARLDVLEAALQGACARLEEVQADLELFQPEPDTGASAGSVPPARSAINLTKRAQVLRLHRRGEAVPTIASTVGLPQKEVELLLKVQRLLLEQS